MNRLTELLASDRKGLLVIYMTPAYPEMESTIPILKAIGQGGADIIEVGIPFSDPLADGPTIQNSSQAALNNGVNLADILETLRDNKGQIDQPIVLMGYVNSIIQYGVERFCQDSRAAGVDGVILPDLPMYYYDQYCKQYFERYHLHPIYLITPATTDERIRIIDKQSSAFIYAVSSASTTGGAEKSGVNVPFLERLKALQLKCPILVGFNVKNRKDHQEISTYVRGSIIGSAFIRSITAGEDPVDTARLFVSKIKK